MLRVVFEVWLTAIFYYYYYYYYDIDTILTKQPTTQLLTPDTP